MLAMMDFFEGKSSDSSFRTLTQKFESVGCWKDVEVVGTPTHQVNPSWDNGMTESDHNSLSLVRRVFSCLLQNVARSNSWEKSSLIEIGGTIASGQRGLVCVDECGDRVLHCESLANIAPWYKVVCQKILSVVRFQEGDLIGTLSWRRHLGQAVPIWELLLKYESELLKWLLRKNSRWMMVRKGRCGKKGDVEGRWYDQEPCHYMLW